MELHSLQLRYWGQAIPDYNNYHTRPLIAPPPVRYFEPNVVPKNWNRWAPDDEVRADYALGLVDWFLYNADLDSKSEASYFGYACPTWNPKAWTG